MGSVAVVPAAWRPPQWAQPPMVLITVPAGYTTNAPNGTQITAVSNGVATLSTTVNPPSSYVFDAVIAAEHDQTLTKTRHPVQTGSDITTNAYLEPATLVLYVLMSDAVAAYVAGYPGASSYIRQWTGNPSKSISAYQQILNLQALRIPLSVTTRLRSYINMLIMKVSPKEDATTIGAARFRLEMEQVYMAGTQVSPISTRANDTSATALGTVNNAPIPVTTKSQFGVNAFGPGGSTPPLPPDLGNGSTPVVENGWFPGYENPDGTFTPQYPNSVALVNVPGAGDYSSNVVTPAGAVFNGPGSYYIPAVP